MIEKEVGDYGKKGAITLVNQEKDQSLCTLFLGSQKGLESEISNLKQQNQFNISKWSACTASGSLY